MASLGLTGHETLAVRGIGGGITPRQEATVEAIRPDGGRTDFGAIVRVDGPAEVDYYRSGGILRMVLRQLLAADSDPPERR